MQPIASVRFRSRRYRTALSYLRDGDAPRVLGWRGHHNLGDEVVYDAVARHFAPHPVTWRPEFVPGVLRSRVERTTHRLTILGGGTLLGGRYLDDFLGEPDPARRAVFGAGVIDPAFPHSYRTGREALDHWVDALDGVAHIGVRGPRSVELLADRGVDAELLGDPVAAFAPDRPDRPNPDAPRVLGVNVGASAGGMWGDGDAMLDAYAVAVRQLAAAGWSLEYHVVTPPDVAVTRRFMATTRTESAPLVVNHHDGDRAIATMTRLSAFVGVKLHAVALAACGAVPTVSLEYHPKCRDFMASIGRDNWTLHGAHVTPSAIVDAVLGAAADPAGAAAAHAVLLDQRERQREFAAELLGQHPDNLAAARPVSVPQT